jgi:hypothetical protein
MILTGETWFLPERQCDSIWYDWSYNRPRAGACLETGRVVRCKRNAVFHLLVGISHRTLAIRVGER